MNDIALLGDPAEPEIERLAGCLADLGRAPLVIDTAGLPRRHALTFSDTGWHYDGQSLNGIRTFFLRGLHCNDLRAPGNGEPPPSLEALQEKSSLLGSLLRWAVTHGKPVVNPLSTQFCHYYKLHTQDHLKQAGVPVPATFAGNAPDAVRAFVGKHGEVISKPLAGGRETVALTADDLTPEFLNGLLEAPVMLQERIHGADIRAYVLGGRVIAAAALLTDHVDFRTGLQNFKPTSLSAEECRAVLEAARAMHLGFTGIDFKRAAKGRAVILDVNPAPMFAGFEGITGLNIAGPLAKYLAGAGVSAQARKGAAATPGNTRQDSQGPAYFSSCHPMFRARNGKCPA